MKTPKYILLILTNLIFLSIAYPQSFEEQFPKEGILHYYKVEKVPGASKIFAVGDDGALGVIKLSQDNGKNWTFLTAPTFNTITSIDFVNDTTGFIGTNKGEIFKTTNGAQTWQLSYFDKLKSIQNIKFLDSDTGYVAGDKGNMLKTTNRGVTWTYLPTGYKATLNDLWIFSGKRCLAVGYNGLIVKTEDGGITWDSLKSFTINPIFSISFPGGSTGYLVGGGTLPVILKSTDNGANWITYLGNISASTNIRFTSVYFFDQLNGFMVNANSGFYLHKTTDGGQTWIKDFYLSQYPMQHIHFTDSNTGFIAGGDNTLLRTGDKGKSWTVNKEFTMISNNQGYSFPQADTGYIIGSLGTLLKTVNGGNNWVYLKDTLNQLLLSSIDFFTGTTGIGGDFAGNMYRCTDGGKTWGKTYASSSTVNAIYAIDFLPDGKGFAGGWKTIMKTLDFGKTWTNISDASWSNYIIREIQYINATTIVMNVQNIQVNAGQYPAKILKSTDGGTSWQSIADLPDRLADIHFTSPTTGYVAIGSSQIRKTIDGGINWTTSTVATAYNNIFFVNDLVGYFTSSIGLLKTINGGASWQQVAFQGGLGGFLIFEDANTGYIINSNQIIKAGALTTSLISPNLRESHFSIYPNPSKGEVHIKAEAEGYDNLAIYNSTGQIVRSFNLEKNHNLSVQNLDPGFYIVILYGPEGRKGQRLIIEN